MMDLAVIEREVLSLDFDSRERLMGTIAESLRAEQGADDISDERRQEIEGLWSVEVERRMKEWDENPSIGIPYETVMAELRAKLS